MRVGNVRDGVATGIAWLPMLLVLGAVALFLYTGVANLEAVTPGSEVVMPNSISTNQYAGLGDSQQP